MSLDVRRPIDRLLLFFAVMLMAFGMVWVFSSSALKSKHTTNIFIINQMIGGVIGILVMLLLSQTDLSGLKSNGIVLKVLYFILVILLGLVFCFPSINHAHRWIHIGKLSIQPSEFFKPLSVLITAWWIVYYQERCNNGYNQLIIKNLILFIIVSLPLCLILREPDFGTSFLILSVVLIIMFLGGMPQWLFLIIVPILATVGFAFIWLEPYRRLRVINFFHLNADPLGKGHQAIQSLIAVGNGGITGVGLGASMQKLNYLPEAHTDFIYAVIAEEAGFIGSTLVLFLFIGILWRGYRIVWRVRDNFLKLSAMGATLLLVIQALMNVSVVLSLAPNKGIPLPFISYGSSSLISSLISLGILLSISKEVSE